MAYKGYNLMATDLRATKETTSPSF